MDVASGTVVAACARLTGALQRPSTAAIRLRYAEMELRHMTVPLIGLFNVARLLALVDGGFGRRVESEDCEVPFAGNCRQPIGAFALWRFRP